MEIAVIGGGAAGFYAAINVKENYPDYAVTVYERSSKVLQKVKISGGGRCNFTNNCNNIDDLCNNYPRGGSRLKKIFFQHSNKDTLKWFENHGVEYVVDQQNCVFPRSQNSQTIIDSFFYYANKYKIDIQANHCLKQLQVEDEKLKVVFENGQIKLFDKVIVAIGGINRLEQLLWLQQLGHKIVEPVASLFSFALDDKKITELAGIVVKNTVVSLIGTKYKCEGDLLITHWGVSGPAILKLSSIAARFLFERNYKAVLSIGWLGDKNEEKVRNRLLLLQLQNSQKNIVNARPDVLQERLWKMLLQKCDIATDRKWGEIGKNAINKLTTLLTNDLYNIDGRAPNKDEFVTCGGVALESVDLLTMRSRVVANLYFAGEILDIDGFTGGFNLQNAWSTAFVAAKLG